METARKHVVHRLVVSGNTVELYDYAKPVLVDFARAHDVVRDPSNAEKGKREDNLYRARKNVRQLVWANLTPHTNFLTLTCAESCLEEKKFMRYMQTFFQTMKRYGYPLKYLYVLERQLLRGAKEGNAGSIHAHLVVFNDEKIPLDVLKKAWKHGRTEIRMLNGLRWDNGEKVRDAGAYICKYITKEAALEWGSRTYRCSKGLGRPVELCTYAYGDGDFGYVVDDNDVLEGFVNFCDFSYSAKKDIHYFLDDGTLVENTVFYRQGRLIHDG